jgi:predicted ester cyclase
VTVKNTFLDLSVITDSNCDHEEPDVLGARRRPTSAPPVPFEEAMYPSSPSVSPRGEFKVIIQPVKACTMNFLKTMSEESEETLDEFLQHGLTPDANLQVHTCINDIRTGIANCQGRDEVISYPKQLRKAIPDLRFSLGDVVCETRKGVNAIGIVRVTCSGTQSYPFLPIIPCGTHVSFELHMETFEKVDGKSSRVRWNFCMVNPVMKMVRELSLRMTGGGTTTNPFFPEDAVKGVDSEVVEAATAPMVTMQPVLCVSQVTMQPFLCVGQMPMHQPSSRQQALEAQRAELAQAALRALQRLESLETVAPAKSAGKGSRAKQTQPSSTKRLAAAKAQDQNPKKPTTLMIRNLPLDLTREMLLKTLDTEGFAQKYDFAYLPRDFQRPANLGYCFVNLLTHEVAVEMMQHFEGFCRWGIRCPKKVAVVWGTTQGLGSYVGLYRNNPVMHESVPEESKPVMFRDGERVVFPAPTRKLKAPRLNPSLNYFRGE